jgi:NAD-dependent deacetylase
MNKPLLVVLSGAGISAESGLKTFRDADGLWENHNIMDVATPEAWSRNPALVLKFYNDRRSQLRDAQPNQAHFAIAMLEEAFEVKIITQNVDNLHERAGSSHVMHLHGELVKARSSAFPQLIYEIGYRDIVSGETCEKGSPLRPHIVWFGEEVPLIESAAHIIREASIVLVVGTSLNVYPAAGLIHEAPFGIPKFLVDPGEFDMHRIHHLTHIRETAGKALPELAKKLIEEQHNL